MEKKNAISLIVLVITIIVMAILAATVIITLSNTNIISQANDAVIKDRLSKYKEELTMYIANETSNNSSFDMSTLQAAGDELKTIIPSLRDEDKAYLEIQDGVLKTTKDAPADFKEIASGVGLTQAEAKTIAAYAHAGNITEDMIMYPDVFTYTYNDNNMTAEITGLNGSVTNLTCGSYTLDETLKQRVQGKITEAGGKFVVPYEVEYNGKTYKVTGDLGYVKGTDYSGNYQYESPVLISGWADTEWVIPNTISRLYVAGDGSTKSRTVIVSKNTYVDISVNGDLGMFYGKIVLTDGWENLDNLSSLPGGGDITLDIPSSVTSIGENKFAMGTMGVYLDKITLNIHKPKDSISGYPWGADESRITVNWLGE